MGPQPNEGVSGPTREQGGPTVDWGTAGTSCYYRIHPGSQAGCHAGAGLSGVLAPQGLQGSEWHSGPGHQGGVKKEGKRGHAGEGTTVISGLQSSFCPSGSLPLVTQPSLKLEQVAQGLTQTGSKYSDSRTESLSKKCFL